MQDQTVCTTIEERLDALQPYLGREAFEIGQLGLPDHLDPTPGEIAVESREGQSWTITHRFEHLVLKSGTANDDLHLQTTAPLRDELAEGERRIARDLPFGIHGRFIDQLRGESARAARTLPLRAFTRILRS